MSPVSAGRRLVEADLSFSLPYPENDPSLDEVATPMRDVGCFVGVEKQLQFFIVPLKWVISRKCGKKEKKKKVRTVPWTAESSVSV